MPSLYMSTTAWYGESALFPALTFSLNSTPVIRALSMPPHPPRMSLSTGFDCISIMSSVTPNLRLTSIPLIKPHYRIQNTTISRKVVRTSAPDNPERYCGWFWILCSSKKFERMARYTMDVCLRVLKKCNKSRLDSYRLRKCVDHIPYYLSGLSRAHFFRQPFSKYLVTLLTPADSLLWWFVNVTTTNMARSVSHCMRGNMDNTVA